MGGGSWNSCGSEDATEHLVDTALWQRISLVECPITFHKRLGESKGGTIRTT